MGDPLLGFSSPTRSFPKSPPAASRPTGTSPGVPCPYSASGRGSPRPARCRAGAPVSRVCSDRSRPAGYGAARRFSQPLSGFYLPPPSCHFQTGGAPGVPPFRGLFRSRSPDDSSSPACPLDVPPVGWPSPDLGGGASGRADRLPRIPRSTPFFVFRAFVRVRVGRCRQARLAPCD